MNFEDLNLNKPLLNALSDIGYMNPTPIQEKAFPVIMSGRDVVCIAQTGTGKTFAYLLPLLRSLAYSEQRQPRILIVVPTRELVLQVVAEVEKLTTYMNIRCQGVYGGVNINTQKESVYGGVDVLVATPGRLMDLALTSVLRLRSVQKLVIDEVDEMFNQGFRTQLTAVIGLLPKKRQNLLVSATLSEDVEKFIKDVFYDPFKIEVISRGTPLEKIVQKAYHVPNFYTKINLLEHLLADKNLSKVLVFVKSRKLADLLYKEIESKFPDKVDVIHSNKSQPQRINSVKQFDDGTYRVLIATDIIARGLDIKDITHVINIDTPDSPGDYIHRIGRTGRADKAGEAVTFVNEDEQVLMEEIEKMMNKTIPLETFPEEVVISPRLLEDEKDPVLFDKNYMKIHTKKDSGGKFHEKKEKNKKVNLGGPSKRNPRMGSAANKRNKKNKYK